MNADDMVRIAKRTRDFFEVVHEFEHKQWHDPQMEKLEEIDCMLHNLMEEVREARWPSFVCVPVEEVEDEPR